jgi:hypothetical protein
LTTLVENGAGEHGAAWELEIHARQTVAGFEL